MYQCHREPKTNVTQVRVVFKNVADSEIIMTDFITLLDEHLLNNIFFDTCVYHQPGIDLLTKVIPVKNILFASEMIGAVRGIDPTTGHYYDDTKRYIEAAALSSEERHQIYEGNARRVYPRLDAALNAKGLTA